MDVATRTCKQKTSDLQFSEMHLVILTDVLVWKGFSIDIQSKWRVTYEETSSIKWHQQHSILISLLYLQQIHINQMKREPHPFYKVSDTFFLNICRTFIIGPPYATTNLTFIRENQI